MKTLTQKENPAEGNIARRSFLRYAGMGAAAVGVFAAASCRKDSFENNASFDVGAGDTGILNYAYALEQLEAAFYTQVVATPYASASSSGELAILTDIRDHEVAHRELFKAALGINALPGLTPNFTSVNFSDRTSVLNTAKAFEDLGVAAYNGAGALIQSPAYLTLAGKIVSVEARHASLIRDLISYNSFITADIVDLSTGLEISKSPAQVLAVANTFLSGKKLTAASFGA
jgi:hypothetical protein